MENCNTTKESMNNRDIVNVMVFEILSVRLTEVLCILIFVVVSVNLLSHIICRVVNLEDKQ